MPNTVWAIVRKGKVELLEHVGLSEGTTVLVTVFGNGDTQFWLRASEDSLKDIWGNPEDDVYAQLLEK